MATGGHDYGFNYIDSQPSCLGVYVNEVNDK